MPITELILGAILAVISLGLIIAVLMQPGKDKRLSGAIAGGAETFFGKSKAKEADKWLGIATTIVSIVFAVLAVVMYIYISTLH